MNVVKIDINDKKIEEGVKEMIIEKKELDEFSLKNKIVMLEKKIQKMEEEVPRLLCFQYCECDECGRGIKKMDKDQNDGLCTKCFENNDENGESYTCKQCNYPYQRKHECEGLCTACILKNLSK